jgi:hypothetical protein
MDVEHVITVDVVEAREHGFLANAYLQAQLAVAASAHDDLVVDCGLWLGVGKSEAKHGREDQYRVS